MRRSYIAVLAVSVLTLSSCAQIGQLSNILGAIGQVGGAGQQQQPAQLQAQVQQVDPRSQRLYVRTQQGQTGSVLFDGQTVVVYNQRQYPVTALEPGDVVVLQLHQVSQSELYASRIDVTQPSRTRS
jgi:outer membrane lipoprotein-sorting protein